jgi:hypothetical protein
VNVAGRGPAAVVEQTGSRRGAARAKEKDVAVPEFFQTIEQSALSVWVRESTSVFAFWFILAFHALGLGLVVGISGVIALRLLGAVRALPIAPLKQLYPAIWVGFWIQVVSGLLILIGYPTKNLTNVIFYPKLLLVAAGMYVMARLRTRVLGDASLSDAEMMVRGKGLALASLVCWVGAVTLGRFLGYTYTHATYPVEQSAMVETTLVMLRAWLP